MRSLNLSEQVYICESDKSLPDKEQTKFYWKPLSAKQDAVTKDILRYEMKRGTEDVTFLNWSQKEVAVLKAGLIRWENFPDANGVETPFNANDMDATISRIPPAIRTELANVIAGYSELAQGEQKN
jgi:hypothetical protein